MKTLVMLICVLLLVSTAPTLAQQPRVAGNRGLTPEDYYAFRLVSNPQLSPNGALVAYVVTSVNESENRRFSSIWVTRTDGSTEPRRLTMGPYSSSSPAWSPDGRSLAFLSARSSAPAAEARPQVYLISPEGGEARRVTDLKNGVTRFAWSPDGTRLVCVSRTGPQDRGASGRAASDTRHITRLIYKTNDTFTLDAERVGKGDWLDGRRSHLWLVDVRTGASRQITEGDDWDDTDPQWSPDGTQIAFVSDRTGKQDDARGNPDVWVVAADGGQLRKISVRETVPTSLWQPAREVSEPRWSPDGTTIAFLARLNEQTFPKIWLAPSRGGTPARLAINDLDLFPSGLRWGDKGRALYFRARFRGEYHVFRLDLATKKIRPVTAGPRAIHEFLLTDKTRRLLYTANDFKHLDDLYVADLAGNNERQLTHVNRALWEKLELADVERVTYRTADGWEIEGFVVKPLNWQPGKKYPMIVEVHGGPGAMLGVGWSYDFQVYAAQEWAVFYPNFRGSTGYGERCERAVKGEWGGKAYTDIMEGVKVVLKKHPWVDRDRVGVTGLSFGGFMTNWIVGHTNLFKAAVTVNGISNPISQEGTRFVPFPRVADFGDTVWDNFEVYWNNAPLQYARNVRTPTLILHGERDFMVSLEQGEQWYRALKYFGVLTEMVVFPRAGHRGLSLFLNMGINGGEPRDIVEALNWKLYWFHRFLNGNDQSPTPGGRPTLAGSVKQ